VGTGSGREGWVVGGGEEGRRDGGREERRNDGGIPARAARLVGVEAGDRHDVRVSPAGGPRGSLDGGSLVPSSGEGVGAARVEGCGAGAGAGSRAGCSAGPEGFRRAELGVGACHGFGDAEDDEDLPMG